MRLGELKSVLPMHGKQNATLGGRMAITKITHTHTVDYPVRLDADDNGTIMVSFPDFPEAVTFGEDEDDALARAQDALATIIEAYVKDRQRLPVPSAGTPRVIAPALVAAKAKLSEVMLAAHVKKSELADRLNWHMPQVDRILDVRHGSGLDQLEAAASALGQRLVIVFEPKEPVTSHIPGPVVLQERRKSLARSGTSVVTYRRSGRITAKPSSSRSSTESPFSQKRPSSKALLGARKR